MLRRAAYGEALAVGGVDKAQPRQCGKNAEDNKLHPGALSVHTGDGGGVRQTCLLRQCEKTAAVPPIRHQKSRGSLRGFLFDGQGPQSRLAFSTPAA